MRTITDIDDKVRNAESLVVIINRIKNSVTGKLISEKYVEAMIIGKYRKWKQYYPLKEFRKKNPNIGI